MSAGKLCLGLQTAGWILEAYCTSVGLEATACWHLTAGWYFGLLFVASLLFKQNCSTDL